jgi:hypothetical protein
MRLNGLCLGIRQSMAAGVDFAPTGVTGRKTEKVVPERPCFHTLLTRLVPVLFHDDVRYGS